MRLDLEQDERKTLEAEVNSIDWLGLDEVQIEEKVSEFANKMSPIQHDSADACDLSEWKTNLLIMIISKIKPNSVIGGKCPQSKKTEAYSRDL